MSDVTRASRKVAFVTGAASGIGKATAESFVAHGWATVLADRDAAVGREVEAALRASGECRFVVCDVTSEESIDAAMAATMTAYGRLDAAFNAAGIGGELGRATADGSVENWNRVIATDLTGVWLCMRRQIPRMLETGGGSIVNCASTIGLVGSAYFGAYSAAKHGVVGLTRTAALEYVRRGLRVNAVCPGPVDTPMVRNSMGPEIEAMIAQTPPGRMARPQEIAAMVLWLCGDGASFVTGQAIAVDGGLTAQ
jgi:NAD(P)-dependent dehydrogenase (short-subunit alcohol dehydrogenase family)